MQAKKYLSGILTLLLICGFSALSFAQANGSLKGTVTLESQVSLSTTSRLLSFN